MFPSFMFYIKIVRIVCGQILPTLRRGKILQSSVMGQSIIILGKAIVKSHMAQLHSKITFIA